MIRLRDGEFVRDHSPGAAGSQGLQHEFPVTVREPDHPIMRGLPVTWLNGRDELYGNLQIAEANMTSAGLDLDQINSNKNDWAKLDANDLETELKGFPDVNDNLELLTGYVKTYAEWSTVAVAPGVSSAPVPTTRSSM